MANTILGPDGQPISSSNSSTIPPKQPEPHALDEIVKASTNKVGQFDGNVGDENFSKYLREQRQYYNTKVDKEAMSWGEYLGKANEGASAEAFNRLDDFAMRTQVARNNVQANIDRYQAKLDNIGDTSKLGYTELQGHFNQKQLSAISKQAAQQTSKTSLLEGMQNKVGYVKAAAKDHVFNLFMGGSAERMADTTHYRDRFKTQQTLNRIDKTRQAEEGIMRERLDKKKVSLQRAVDSHNGLMKNIDNYDVKSINAAQTGKGAFTTAAHNSKATVMSEKAASKGWGWKGKAGAVAGLLALGGIIGNQFAGGHKSNAELYNPNPQPQYYS